MVTRQPPEVIPTRHGLSILVYRDPEARARRQPIYAPGSATSSKRHQENTERAYREGHDDKQQRERPA